MLIFKAVPAKEGRDCGNKRSVTYEIFHNLKDKWGHYYPDRTKVYITVSGALNGIPESL